MKVKNKYVIRSRISEKKFREIIKYFFIDLNAVQIKKLTGLSRQTINKYLTAFRLRIVELSQLQSVSLVGQIEVDESYFVARRVRGKRGRGALGKTIVFGLLKRGDKVYTEIVPNCKSATLQRIIKGKTGIDSVIHSDGWRGYNGLKYSVKSRLSCHDPINKMERITMIKSDFSGLSYAGNSACLVCDSSDQGILGHRESHEDSGADIEEVLEGEGVGVLLKAFDQASLVVGMAQLLALVSDPSTAARCVSTAEKHFSLDVGAIRYRSIYERLGG